MKKILHAVATGAVCLSVMGGTAAAATVSSNCSITNGNGTGSTNLCQFDANNHIIFTCVNDVLVVNGTDQTSTSGIVQTNANTAVGTVSSGNAINNGETTTNVDATCIPAPKVTPTVATPAGGGQGAGAAAPAAAPKAAVALPKTGSNTVVNEAIGGVAIVTALLAVSQLGIQAYRRIALK